MSNLLSRLSIINFLKYDWIDLKIANHYHNISTKTADIGN